MVRNFLCGFLPLLVAGGRFDPSTVPPLGRPPPRMYEAEELVAYYGYNSTLHHAVTDDGYVLPVTRILNKMGPPVLFFTGLGIGRELWIIHGPDYDLPFILSDLGYDVWMTSHRGHRRTSHMSLDSNEAAFWNFTFCLRVDEMGRYDLPAAVDLVRSETGDSRLFYVGYSAGGSALFIMCSERPTYCPYIATAALVAPGVYSERRTLPTDLKLIRSFINFGERIGIHGVSRRPENVDPIIKICDIPLVDNICIWFVNLWAGVEKKNVAPGWRTYTFLSSASGTSALSFEHAFQAIESGGLPRFDWGPEKNLILYGTDSPPHYNLTKMTIPTAVYYSKIDKLISYQSMKKLLSIIPNLIRAIPVQDPSYGHADLGLGKDLYKLLYSDIVDLFDSFSGE